MNIKQTIKDAALMMAQVNDQQHPKARIDGLWCIERIGQGAWSVKRIIL